MKITHLRVTNYRGIANLDETIPPAGAVVAGGNGRGKTSVIKAIRAALAAQDIGPDAVRIGADRAEILVDLDALSVRRTISSGGATTIKVTRDGMVAQKPQAYLAELLGTAPLDPLDLLLAKPKERRAKVLEALPIRVTREQIAAWLEGFDDGGVDVSGHGLEVVDALRQRFYKSRTAANKAATTAVAEAKRLAEAHAQIAATVPVDAPSLGAAENALEVAKRELALLAMQRIEATRAEARSDDARRHIATLEAEAETLRRESESKRVDDAMLAGARESAASHDAVVEDLARRLVDAKAEQGASHARVTELVEAMREATKLAARAAERLREAETLRATVAAIAIAAPDAAALEDATAAVNAAELSREAARRAADAENARQEAERARRAAEAESIAADRLDVVVRRLTNEAPAELLATAQGIPGLGLDGDDVTLDGVRLDALSGAEQMRFCVEVARRLNAKSRILIVDGLERLDEEQRETFVRHATEGGFQLLGTLVTKGEATFGAIEPGDGAEAAAQ